MRSLVLYFQTLRYLRFVQFYRRVWFRFYRPRPDFSPAPNLAHNRGTWVAPACRAQSVMGPENFVFLDVPGSLSAGGWDNPNKAKLWRYNLHYFDDLNAKDALERRNWQTVLIERWVDENPAASGSGWEPYPTSLRIVNWVKFALSDGELSAKARHSLAVQVRWLTKKLEWHLLGNHLFANAKALLFAGLFFDGPEALKWRKQSVRILEEQIQEQILPDGGHFELSPMYHALAFEDMLDLLNILRARGTNAEASLGVLISDRLYGMADWLRLLSHPDGDIAFFNDTAIGVAPDNSQLFDYAARLNLDCVTKTGSRYLTSSGYFRMESVRAVLLADIAHIGPDYLPGHAHADTLSFELSLYEHRVIVNSGTSEYGLGSERHRQRSTPAHSTVTVAGQNSSEVWAGFRVARRARVNRVMHDCKKGWLEASHCGYQRLSPPSGHVRRWLLNDGRLTVTDTVAACHSAEARFHLHPDVTVEQIESHSGHHSGQIVLPAGQRIWFTSEAASIRLEESTWHPKFGQSIRNQCIVLAIDYGACSFQLTWDC